MSGTFPPAGPALTKTIPSYLYQQYSDDDDLQAFVAAYNQATQNYVDTFNDLNLPIYTGLTGALLDWVGAGLYGQARPTLSYSVSAQGGEFNTYVLNGNTFNGRLASSSTTLFTVTDDIYQRILTWNFYKGDGFEFTTRWLKRRVARFLVGANGTSLPIDQTYDVSVQWAANRVVNITIYDSTGIGNILQAAIAERACYLPFIYTFNVTVVSSVPIYSLTGEDGLYLKGADGLYLTYAH